MFTSIGPRPAKSTKRIMMVNWRWGIQSHATQTVSGAGRGTGKTFSWQYHLSGRCDSGTPPSTYLHTGWLFFPRGFTPRQTTNFILPESKSPCRPQSASSGILPGHMRGDGSTGTCLYATRRQTATGCHNTIERNPTTALGRQRGEIG